MWHSLCALEPLRQALARLAEISRPRRSIPTNLRQYNIADFDRQIDPVRTHAIVDITHSSILPAPLSTPPVYSWDRAGRLQPSSFHPACTHLLLSPAQRRAIAAEGRPREREREYGVLLRCDAQPMGAGAHHPVCSPIPFVRCLLNRMLHYSRASPIRPILLRQVEPCFLLVHGVIDRW